MGRAVGHPAYPQATGGDYRHLRSSHNTASDTCFTLSATIAPCSTSFSMKKKNFHPTKVHYDTKVGIRCMNAEYRRKKGKEILKYDLGYSSKNTVGRQLAKPGAHHPIGMGDSLSAVTCGPDSAAKPQHKLKQINEHQYKQIHVTGCPSQKPHAKDLPLTHPMKGFAFSTFPALIRPRCSANNLSSANPTTKGSPENKHLVLCSMQAPYRRPVGLVSAEDVRVVESLLVVFH